MSHPLMGSSASSPSSPTIRANGEQDTEQKHNGGRPGAGALIREPVPSAPQWISHALKTLDNYASLTSRPEGTARVQYDSPYSRSRSSTAPGSPRM